jgi:hypothetical protein
MRRDKEMIYNKRKKTLETYQTQNEGKVLNEKRLSFVAKKKNADLLNDAQQDRQFAGSRTGMKMLFVYDEVLADILTKIFD